MACCVARIRATILTTTEEENYRKRKRITEQRKRNKVAGSIVDQESPDRTANPQSRN